MNSRRLSRRWSRSISPNRMPIKFLSSKLPFDIWAGCWVHGTSAFDTHSGLPVASYWWKQNTSGKLPGEDKVIIAQIASLSLEFIRLSQVTGDLKYATKIQIVTDQLALTQNLTALPGMWPIQANCTGTHLSFQDRTFSLGVLAGEISSLLY